MGSYDAKRRGLHPLGTHLLVVIFAAAFLFAGTAAVVIAGPAGPASAQAEGTYGCPPGSFFDGDGCYLVPIGSYQPYQGWDEAFACPLPTSTASTGATDSAQCNVLPGPGQYASDQVFYAITQPFDVVVFQLCAPGTYQPFEGQTSCYAAPPGSYIDVSGATEIDEARPCPGGTYSTGGAAACADAPPGTAPGNFNGGWGATDVVNCNPGTTSPGGQYSCDPAPPGSYEPYYGEASPFTCAAGTYQPGYGATACVLADVDHYVPGEGATSELSCPAGTHQPVTGSKLLPARPDDHLRGTGRPGRWCHPGARGDGDIRPACRVHVSHAHRMQRHRFIRHRELDRHVHAPGGPGRRLDLERGSSE